MNGWLLLLVVAVPLEIGHLLAIGEVAFLRRDLAVGRRIAWLVCLVLVPLLSLAAYASVRPPRARSALRERAAARNDSARRLVSAVEQRARGEIDDDAYDRELTRILGPELTL